jgi:hypothetical protein
VRIELFILMNFLDKKASLLVKQSGVWMIFPVSAVRGMEVA